MIDFVVVGPGRSGTTWLYELFRSCNEVQLARDIKEPEFFNSNYHRGIPWYRGLYNNFNDENKTYGDLSNMYIMSDKAIGRLARDCPEVKVILMIREPISKLRSLFLFKQREGLFNGSIKDFSESEFFADYLMEIDYAHHLELLLSHFNRDNIYLFDYSILHDAPEKLIEDLGDFLGVKTLGMNFVNRRINASIVPKYFWLGKAAKKSAKILRRLGAYKLLTSFKRSELIKSIFFRRLDSEGLDISDISRDKLDQIMYKNDQFIEMMKKDKWIKIDGYELY
jgi:hypothetical protein